MRSHYHRCRGFTLLEVLVAAAVFAIMAVMAYGGLSNVIDNSEASKAAMRRLQEIQLAMIKLDRDFSQISRRSIRDEYGNSTNFLMTDANSERIIEFTRSGRRNPAELLRSHLLRVAYRLDENELTRMYWYHLDRSQAAQPVENLLLTGVNAFEVRYLDNSGEWQNEWPPLSAPGGGAVSLIAIEVLLNLEDWGDLSRLYATGAL